MNHEERTLIVGLGKTGLSCARFLAARGVPFAVTDSRTEPPCLAALRQELPEVEVFTGRLDPALLCGAAALVVSPGVALAEPAIAAALAQGVPVTGDIELFARQARAPVAAITGSNGKSTVTTLLGEMALRAGFNTRIGGNLGTPALELLDANEPDLYVLELSSFQLETTHSLNAAAAVVLNITPDHMDRYADFAAYARTKRQVYHGDGAVVVNLDDSAPCISLAGRQQLRYGLAHPPQRGDFGIIQMSGDPWLALGDDALLPVHELRMTGHHNVSNALAALALGHALHLPRPAMLAALRDFTGLPHRTQWIAEQDSVSWFNDSKGTNVGATLAALRGLADGSGKIVLIAGGEGKGADFSALRPAVAAAARAVVLMGRDAALIGHALHGATRSVFATDMANAVRQARQLAQPGDRVLLSPACASFDMYSGYEQRGHAFVAAVHACLNATSEMSAKTLCASTAQGQIHE